MNPSLELMLPALGNLPVFFIALISLGAMLLVSCFSIYRRFLGAPDPVGSISVRLCILALQWVMLGFWSVLAAFWVGFAGMAGGTGLFLFVSLAIVLAFALLTWALTYWVRGRVVADWIMATFVVSFVIGIYIFQRAWICEPLAWSGLGVAQYCTGTLYETGEGGVIRRRGTALFWYKKAAEKGVAAAQYKLAMNTHSHADKQQLLSRAAQGGNLDAAYHFYMSNSRDPDAIGYLQKAAMGGHIKAQYQLGLIALNGAENFARDLELTRELWMKSAEQGSLASMQALAIAYARGGVLFDYDPDISRYWEQQAMETVPGQDRSPFENVLSLNWERILKEVRERSIAAESGDAAAQLALGREILKQSQDDPDLVIKAMSWIEKSAQSGSLDAQFQIAEFYLEPEATQESNQENGRHWLTLASQGGHEDALRKITTALKDGAHGFEKDLYRARDFNEQLFEVLDNRSASATGPHWRIARWEYQDILQQIRKQENQYLPPQQLKDAVAQGDPVAQYHLAKEIMGKEFDRGLALLVSSAEGGYAQAKFEMSQRIRHRKRTDDEERQAILWLQEAVASDHRGAMVDLSQLYSRGLPKHGITKNPYKAKVLLQRAMLDQGDIIYEQKTSRGSWQYTRKSVNRRLDRIPAAVKRLDLEGLTGQKRTQVLEEWYGLESDQLRKQATELQGDKLIEAKEQLAMLESQYEILSE